MYTNNKLSHVTFSVFILSRPNWFSSNFPIKIVKVSIDQNNFGSPEYIKSFSIIPLYPSKI